MPTSTKQISFLKYNNYANRTTHPGDTFEDIFGTYNVLTHRYANEIARIEEPKLWNPNDGITATIVTPNNTDFSTEPDYLVVWYTVSDEIESRWFVTETVRLHAGQYQCYLRRDVFSEAWNELMAAKCNIHRAIISKYDTLIFNKEPIAVNQILWAETELKDKTGCPWIVFYGDAAFTSDDTVVTTPSMTYDYAVNDLTELTYSANPLDTTATVSVFYPNDFSVAFCWRDFLTNLRRTSVYKYTAIPLNSTGATYYNPSDAELMSVSFDTTGMDWRTVFEQTADVLDIPQYNETPDYYDLSVNDKVIFDNYTQKYYKLSMTINTSYSPVQYVIQSADTDLWATIHQNMIDRAPFSGHDHIGTPADAVPNNFVINYQPTAYDITLTEITVPGTIYADIPNGYLPDDNPYRTWCMPYGDIQVNFNGTTYTTSKTINKNVATAISRKFSRNKIWDVQILPYCPIGDEYFVNGIITTSDTMLTTTQTIYELDDEDHKICKGFIFCLPKSTFETQIMLNTPIDPTDPKTSDIWDVYRLCSPNYGSLFEFSAARNEGIYGFNVRATYMPIQPYIRIAPIWGGLYGDAQFKYDTRGLILGGDFSIARIDDKWVQYQENNKNYAAIFDRQIQNMDVMRGIQVQQEGWGVAAGIFQGVGSGAIAGSAGGPLGAAAGAVVGGVGAGITGGMDMKLSQKAYEENKSYATDIYNLNLANVQAMPRSIAKTTAFNIDNRYFPVLAHYTCSQPEKETVCKFIQNHSMALDAIGTPSSYINNTWSYGGYSDRGFIQGSIIKIDTIHDTHFVDALNDEFRKGVYTK